VKITQLTELKVELNHKKKYFVEENTL
jgi:hypothetical protein